jgi:SAM-dependent methyltransferase
VRRQWGSEPAGLWGLMAWSLGHRCLFAGGKQEWDRAQPWMHETFPYSDWAGKRALEIGIGPDTDHLQFARAAARLTGVDLTPRCMDLTSRRCEQEGRGGSGLPVMDQGLEFPDDSFDCGYSFGVRHTPGPARAFAEIRRALRTGGAFIGAVYARYPISYASPCIERLIYGEYRRENLSERPGRIEASAVLAPSFVLRFSGPALKRTLRDAGFGTVSLRRRHFGSPSFEGRLPGWLEDLADPIGGWYLLQDAR